MKRILTLGVIAVVGGLLFYGPVDPKQAPINLDSPQPSRLAPQDEEPKLTSLNQSSSSPAAFVANQQQAIPYGAEFWQRDQGHNKGINLHKVIDRVSHALVGQEEKWVRSRSYSALLHREGFRFLPLPPNESGASSSQTSAKGVDIRTTMIRQAGQMLYQSDDAEDRTGFVTGNTSQRRLGLQQGLWEHLMFGTEGAELVWILQHDTNLRGDLEIHVEMGGAHFAGATARGLHYADGSGAVRVRVGTAELVDSTGRRAALALRGSAAGFMVEVPIALLATAVFPVAIDPVISAEFGMDNPIFDSGAPGLQRLPKVASVGGDYLVVWEDLRENFRVYGSRVTGNGTILDREGILIAADPRSDSQPAVASNGEEYFVVWVRSQGGEGFSHLYGSRVSRGGLVLDTNGVLVSQMNARQSNPLIAPVGDSYLVVWTQSAFSLPFSGSFVYATRISNEGRSLDGDGFPVSGQLGFNPTLASNGRNFLVAWRTGDGLSCRSISPQGVSGAIVDLGLTNSGIFAPDLGSDQDVFLLVWEQHADFRDPFSSLNFLRLNSAGQRIDPIPRFLAPGDRQYHPAVAGRAGELLVVWQSETEPPIRYDVMSARVDGSTGLVAPPLLVEPGTRNRGGLDLASNGADYLAVWPGTTVTVDIVGSRLGPDGAPLDISPLLISLGANPQFFLAAAGNGQDFLVVWEDYRHGPEPDIYGTRLDPAGTILDPEGLPIARAEGNQRDPAVASNGREYLVVWEDDRMETGMSDIFAGRVGVGGRLLDPDGFAVTRAPFTQHLPAVASNGTNFFVVWHGGPSHGVLGAVVGRDGIVYQTNGVMVSAPGIVQNHVALAGNSSGYLAVWEDRRLFPTSRIDIFGTRISPDGVVLDPSGIAFATNSASQFFPAVGSSGTNFLVVWEDQRQAGDSISNIFATRVMGDRVLDPDGFLVTPSGLRPSVVGGVDGYFVAWQRWEGEWNLDAARVLFDPVEVELFTLNHGAGQQEAPAVAVSGQQYLTAFHGLSFVATTRARGQFVRFTNPVINPADALAQLKNQLQDAALSKKITKDLGVYLDKAGRKIAANKISGAVKVLRSFLQKVERGRGRGIPEPTAEALAASGQELLAALLEP